MTIQPPQVRQAFDTELAIQAASSTTWRLLAPLIWNGTKGDTFTVPIGFITDFATIPRMLVWKVQTYGPYTRAAVLHDWLLTELARWTVETRTGGARGWLPPANSRDCDGIFRRAMRDLGVPWLTRWQMWAAVRLAACFNSRRAYGRHFLRDAPQVFGMMLISAPFVLPGLIGVVISLTLSWPFTKLARRTVRA